MMMTLGEASKATGVSKATLSKALKSGRLSYLEKTSAGYQIDPAELFRVFPTKRIETPARERLETAKETLDVEVLRIKLEAMQQRAEAAEADRDAWKEQAQRLALTDQRNLLAETMVRQSFLNRIFRK